MATSFGTVNGSHGIAAQQTGFLLDSTSEEYTQDSKQVKNITGDDTGETYFNERIEGSLEGWFPASSGYSGTIASAITLATAPTDHLIGAVTGGSYIVQSITRSASSEDYKRIALRYKYSPTILAA